MTRIAEGIPTPTSVGSEDGVGQARALAAAPMQLGSSRTEAGPDRPAPTSGSVAGHVITDARVFFRDINRWEGKYPFMYVDTRGFVTTGIGNKLGSPQEAIELPWRHATTGLPATPAEVRSAFQKVLADCADFQSRHPDGKKAAGGPWYADKTDLVLSSSKVDELAYSRIDGFRKQLRELFPGFDRYPVPAQRALFDMVYTLGKKGLANKFPTVVAACRDGHFEIAAKYCHRKAQANEHREGDARNVATKNLFDEAANLTAAVRSLTREVRL